MWNSVVDDVVGTDRVEGVQVRDTETGEERRSSSPGLFVAIGHAPNTDLFKGQLEMEDNGYLVTGLGAGVTSTNVDGVFACGDVQDHVYRQAITAAGSGCEAAIDTERWLEAMAHDQSCERSTARTEPHPPRECYARGTGRMCRVGVVTVTEPRKARRRHGWSLSPPSPTPRSTRRSTAPSTP